MDGLELRRFRREPDDIPALARLLAETVARILAGTGL